MDFFSNENKVSILFIGEMAYDEFLIRNTKKLPHFLHVAQSAEEILNLVLIVTLILFLGQFLAKIKGVLKH